MLIFKSRFIKTVTALTFTMAMALPAIAGAAEQRAADLRCSPVTEEGRCTLYTVSIIDLIANPERYDGKSVLVSGFLNVEFEGNGLYLHEDDFRHNISHNGIWVSVPRNWLETSKCKNQSYVSLRGVFNAGNRGNMNAWSGSIEAIASCSNK
ncbi:hypothetical protein [Undibacterium sp. TJN19]|uniref:hypothetical protein n=1 Tax=Undibacterium sp. TJN19 TaxID=3413055 RepID=UPI003BF09FF4